MKKKIVLKNWVVKVLEVGIVIAMLLAMTDSTDDKVFFIIHIISAVVMVVNTKLLAKYSDLFDL